MILRCIIMGAAGRDFHDFLRFFRDRPELYVVCFTAHQIPFIESRTFPKELAGPGYDDDIPIFPEAQIEELIAKHGVDFVFLAYSDLSHAEVMHRASRVQAAGASFALLGPKHTQLRSRLPVVSVTASRTGAGKSPLCQALAAHLESRGMRAGVLRHPMPYGDLTRQEVQRFATYDDLHDEQCSVEEREEYTPYIERGHAVYAGFDYEKVLRMAESESDVILWDGGNNDSSFLESGLRITVLDALRPGHELAYYPGETNFRAADVLVVNKVRSASLEDVQGMKRSARLHNPRATLIEADLDVWVDDPDQIAGRRVLVIEDGPTLTHGGMPYGAGVVAAERYGAAAILDPRPHAVGTIANAFVDFPHLELALPALGYSEQQRAELKKSIIDAKPDLVVDGSPAGLQTTLDLDIPVVRARYRFTQLAGPSILAIVDAFLEDNLASS